MSATTTRSRPTAAPFRAPTARLALKSASPSAGPAGLDGAWWPRSRDLPTELSALADVLDPLWGRITRIAVNPRHWPILPPRIVVNGQMVRVGCLTTELDPHGIALLSYTAGRWNLLVIPPETGAPSAAHLMTAASADTGPPRTASALLTAERSHREGGEGAGAPSAHGRRQRLAERCDSRPGTASGTRHTRAWSPRHTQPLRAGTAPPAPPPPGHSVQHATAPPRPANNRRAPVTPHRSPPP
ncbi:DUF5994 family protein [Streptomyces sp. NPDC002779]|uniref:DUF5994 family protein n=1 Tax=Streptomyces sp. NPDC002779 TaxID=3364664 RepID=UPI0036A1C970